MPGPTRPTASSRREDHKEKAKVQPPRPPNAWILYRSHQSAILRQNQAGIAQSTISQMVSVMWKQETEDVKRRFEQLAEEEKLKHQRLYPDYRFCPQRKEDKLRAKEEQKALAKQAKARDATPSDASTSSSVTPAMPPVPALSPPPYWLNSMPISQQYPFPEAFYGPCGPSPPLSAAPSPIPARTPLPSSEEPVASSSSSSLVAPFPSPKSLPTLPQSSTPSEQPLDAPPAWVPSSEYTVAPQVTVWNNDNEVPRPAPKKLDTVKFTVPVVQNENYSEFQQPAAGSSQSDTFFSSNESGAFNMSAMESSNILVHPPVDFQLAEGDDTATIDYHGQFFFDDEFDKFQKQVASFGQADLTSLEALPPHSDLESLFHYPNSAEVDAYTAPQLRQSSASFIQDPVSAWLNFDDTEDSTADLAAVAPQQIVDNTQQVAAMTIFTQMTNVPAPLAASASPYVPPAGAANSSTRRVGGSWKPPFYGPGQTEDSVYSWTFSTN